MKFSKKTFVLLFTFLVILIIASFSVIGQDLDIEGLPDGAQMEQEVEIVATVNGEELTMQELEQIAGIQQITMQLQQQHPEFVELLNTTEEGQHLLDEYKRTQLDNLIEQKLLEMEVAEKDIDLTEEEKDEFFNEQLELIKSQQGMTEEEILDTLSEQGIQSMDDFKEQFLMTQEENLKIHKLIEEEIGDDIEITEEEARQFFEENQLQAEFEEVKPEIENMLRQEKYIEHLKEEADIERKL